MLVGALGDPRVPDSRHARDILLGIRFELDLYVNYRPVTLFDARLCPLKDRTPADIDMAIFRENTEGVYVGVGGRVKPGTEDEIAIQEEVNTWKGVNRIIPVGISLEFGASCVLALWGEDKAGTAIAIPAMLVTEYFSHTPGGAAKKKIQHASTISSTPWCCLNLVT